MPARRYSPLLMCIVVLTAAFAIAQARGERLNGFDLSDPLVPRELIKTGGPPRDGIPSIDHPKFAQAHVTDQLSDTDRVLGLALNGIAKAYPIRILNYHEVVNDQFGDTPVAVTFCPLCGSGIAFDARVNGKRREFGVSGLLYNSDVLMYDRETESLWSQIMGQAVAGSEKGSELKALPVRHTTWAAWRARHPDTLVLNEPRLIRRDYDVDPYLGYATSKRIWAPVAYRDERFHSKAVVVGAIVNDHAHAWPFDALPTDAPSVTHEVGGRTVTLEYDHHTQFAALLDADGQEIPSFTAFWFAWVAFHPDTGVYGAD